MRSLMFSTPPPLGTGSEPSINSTTFGQITNPINGARQMYLRTEIRF